MTSGNKDTARSPDPGDAAEMARLETLLAHNPASPQFVLLANIYIRHGRHDDAIRVCRKGLTNDPENREGHFAVARALEESEQLPAACGALRELIALDETHVSARESLAAILLRRGLFDEARQIAEEAQALGLASGHLAQLHADLMAMAQSPDQTLQGWHVDDPYEGAMVSLPLPAAAAAEPAFVTAFVTAGAHEDDSVAQMMIDAQIDPDEPTRSKVVDSEPKGIGRAKIPYSAGGRLGRIIAWLLFLGLLGAGGLGTWYYLDQREVTGAALSRAANATRFVEPTQMREAIAAIDAVKLSFGAQRDRLRARRRLLVALAELTSGEQPTRWQNEIADDDEIARETKSVARAARAILDRQSPDEVKRKLAAIRSARYRPLVLALGAWQAWLRGEGKAAQAAVDAALAADAKSGLTLLLRGHLHAGRGDLVAARESYEQLLALRADHELATWSRAALALADPAARVVVPATTAKTTTPLTRALERALATLAGKQRDAARFAAARSTLEKQSANPRAHRLLVGALSRALIASCSFAAAGELVKRIAPADPARRRIEGELLVARGSDAKALALADGGSAKGARLSRRSRAWVIARSAARPVRQKKKKKRKRTKKRQRRRQRGAAKAQGDALAAAAKAYRLTGSAARPRRAAARTRRLSELLGAAALGASAPLLAELAIVRALAAGDDTAKSRAALEAAKKICPGHARVSLIAALLDLDADDEKRRAAALKAFRAALAAGARHPRATLVRVRLLLAQGKLDEAQKLVDAQSPRPVASRLARGEIALLQGDAHAALRSVRRAGNGQAVTLLGTRALLALGRVDAAAKRLARLSDERTKQSFAVALLTAELHAARGDQKALVAELERAKTLAGADAARLEMVAPLLSARALLAQSKPKRIALRAAAKLLQIVTKHENAPGRAYRLLGETLAALERKVAARAAFEQAIKLTPKDALAHFGLAEIAAAGKSAEDKAAARAAFKRFLELSRRDERARRKRARRALRQL